MRSVRSIITAAALALTLSTAAVALAQTPDQFVQSSQSQLTTLLKQPASAQRNSQVNATFDQMVDYNELARRCFKEHWATDLNAGQQAEVTDLLKQLIQKNYQKRLNETLNYNFSIAGTRGQGTDTVVKTTAQSTVDPRAAIVQIDYVVAGPANGPFHVVDIVAESSSTVNNYYRSFHGYLTTPGQGYPYLVQKLKTKLAQP